MRMSRVPGLGLLYGSSGTGMDVAVGSGLGLVGIAALKFVWNKASTSLSPAPDSFGDKAMGFVTRALPALSGALTAAGLYAYQRRRNPTRAKAWAVGAVVTGLVINVWDEVRAAVPALADLVSVRLDGYRGMIVSDRARGPYGGMLIDDSSTRSSRNLAELTAINMEPDEE